MRKIVLMMSISLDGYMEGPGMAGYWPTADSDPEAARFMTESPRPDATGTSEAGR
ncbi:hypothetical protein SALBM311S_03485 [Streptomyces alboniger]